MRRKSCENHSDDVPRSTVGAAAIKEDLYKHDVSSEHIITFDVDNSVGNVRPTGMHC